MWLVRSTKWGALLPCLLACAGAAPAPAVPPNAAEVAPERLPTRSPATARDAPLDPDEALGTADSIHRDQLAVGARDDRFSTDRQVAELRKAIVLYQQFIDRAPATRKPCAVATGG